MTTLRKTKDGTPGQRLLLVTLTSLAMGGAGIVGAISLFGYRFQQDWYYGAYTLLSIGGIVSLLVFTILSYVEKSELAGDALSCTVFASLFAFLGFAAALPILL